VCKILIKNSQPFGEKWQKTATLFCLEFWDDPHQSRLLRLCHPVVKTLGSHYTLRSTQHLKIQTVIGYSVEISVKTRHYAELRTELGFANDQLVFK